jgi:hypothetical protein
MAMEESARCDFESAQELERRSIDLAYSLDPSLASQLAEIVDRDPARRLRRNAVDEQLKVLQGSHADRSGDKSDAEDPNLPKILWGSLGLLNGDQLTPKDAGELRSDVIASGRIPISESFPMVIWVVANYVARYSKTDNALRALRPLFESLILTARLTARLVAREDIGTFSKGGHIILSPRPGVLPRVGDRDDGEELLREWISSNVSELLTIADPFFQMEDLDVVKWVMERAPSVRVVILTSPKNKQSNASVEEAWRTYWRLNLSSADPPDTEVVMVTNRLSKSPLHDRWWLSKRHGLRIGTSFGGLGKRWAEISYLSEDDKLLRDKIIEKILTRKELDENGGRYIYSSFTL